MNRERRTSAFDNGDVRRLLRDLRRSEPEDLQTAVGNRLLDCRIWQLPPDGEIVAAAPFLHQCLDVITLTPDQTDCRGLLLGVFSPFPRAGPSGNRSHDSFVGWSIIRAQKQRRVVIAGDPEEVIAGGRRKEVGAEPLAVIFVHISRRFKGRQDLDRGWVVGKTRAVGQIGNGRARDAGVNLTQRAAGLRGDPTGSNGPQQRK